MIAALYVEAEGVYADMPDVDPWPEGRDARKYAGPWPVVAHPPCERWGRYWSGGPSAKVRRKRGDDGDCFEAALAAVRQWGGVLEHPEASSAWEAFGLNRPPRSGGWVVADFEGGWTCCVEQGHYGHRARKATWLYAVGVQLQRLRWGSSGARARLDVGYHSAEERRLARRLRERWPKRLSAAECSATPGPFRDLLLEMARSVRVPATPRPPGWSERHGPAYAQQLARVLDVNERLARRLIEEDAGAVLSLTAVLESSWPISGFDGSGNGWTRAEPE